MRENGLWLLRYNSDSVVGSPALAPRLNWNRVPVKFHFPDSNPNSRMAVRADGGEVLKIGEETLELWRAGKKNYAKVADFAPPSALAISPNGSRWAIASRLYDVSIPIKEKDIFSFDGITLWNAASKRDIARLNSKLGSISALEFSPDSQLLAAVAADGYAFIWNANDGKLVRKWRAHPWVAASLAWSPDGQTLATGANPRLGEAGMWTISIVNGASISGGGGTLSYKGKQLKLATDAQNNLTINGQTDRSLRLWNVKSGQMLRKWESPTGICSAQFSPDGRELAVGTHGEALILNAANLEIKRRLPLENHPNWPASVAWALDGKTLAVACAPQLSLWRAH